MNQAKNVRCPRIKVCGVTVREDVEMLAAEGVDAIGFNFVASSPRCIDAGRAHDLVARAQFWGMLTVGVFRNQPASQIRSIIRDTGIDVVQLHGDETPEIADELAGVPLIKAIAWSGRAEEGMLAKQWSGVGQLLAWLVDAYAPGVGGGTGKVARWDLLQPRPAVFGSVPMLLAGGITPDNVRQAIESVAPDGIDTASGVESAPGRKARALVQRLVQDAKALSRAHEARPLPEGEERRQEGKSQ